MQITDIQEEDRQRQEYKNIDSLAADLLSNGFINPIVVTSDETPRLIAGGRRKTALQALLNDAANLNAEAVHPTMRSFIATGTLEENVHYRVIEMLDGSTLSTLELAENLQREDLTWQETALGIALVHKQKTREAALNSESWGVRETAALLGGKAKKSQISYVTRIAVLLNAQDKEIWAADGLVAAWRIVTQRKASEAATLFAEKSAEDISSMPVLPAGNGAGFQVANPAAPAGPADKSALSDDVLEQLFGADTGADLLQSQTTEAALTAPKRPQRLINFASNYLLGDMVDVYKDAVECVDHIITDPPYGIDMSNLDQGNTGMQNVDNVADTHDKQDNLDNFPKWFETFYRMLRPGGFCVVFCDMQHFTTLLDIAKDAGFQTQRWPLVWAKTHSCLNQAATKNFTKTVEVAILCRKGNAILAKPQHTCVHTASNEAERKQFFGHPFVKPFSLWRWVAQAIAIPGQEIRDPFMGTASMACALVTEGYKVSGCEKIKNHHDQSREQLTTLYQRQFPNETVILN